MISDKVNNFIRDLKKTNKQVYVAGGFPLAMHIGEDPKDIDVFLLGSTEEYPYFSKSGDVQFINGHPFIGKGGNSNYANCVVWWSVIDGQQIELVYIVADSNISSAEDLVKNFDFDICECWIEDLDADEWKPKLSANAKIALKDKCITYKKAGLNQRNVLGASINKEYRVKRITRYKEKFPGFKMVEEL